MEGGAQIGNSAPDQQAQTSNLDPAAASSYQGIQRLKEEEGKEIVQQREETLQSHTSFEKSTTPLRPPAHGKDGSPEPKQEEADEAEEAGPSGRGSVEDVGIGASRRNTTIRPKDCAGSAVWAKLAKYPWWPAQVLDPNDPWIPSSDETPRRGAIPVRFFGTYDFAWIENQRAVCPYRQNYAEHSSTSRQQTFVDAIAEADHFEATQELPNGFNEEDSPSPQKAPRKGKMGKGRGRKNDLTQTNGRSKKRGSADETVIKQRSVKERQESILQALVLAPPPESPFSHQPCLKGVRKLLDMQKAGLWPAPPPKPQPLLAQPFLQYHGVQFPQPQPSSASLPSQFQYGQQQGAASQLQQHHHQFQQQVQQQLQQAHQQGQNSWYLQPNYAPHSSGLHFFGQHGGVPGALLAAANQHQFAMGHHFPAVDGSQPARQ